MIEGLNGGIEELLINYDVMPSLQIQMSSNLPNLFLFLAAAIEGFGIIGSFKCKCDDVWRSNPIAESCVPKCRLQAVICPVHEATIFELHTLGKGGCEQIDIIDLVVLHVVCQCSSRSQPALNPGCPKQTGCLHVDRNTFLRYSTRSTQD